MVYLVYNKNEKADDIMFKKLTGALVITLGLVGSLLVGGDNASAKVNEDVVVSNVGDGQEYAYEITEINGNEIHGVALNKKSSTNAGIFLYKNELDFKVKVGDKIVVMWGEYEDEFELIDRAVKLENGEYVSEKRLKIEALLAKLRNKK